MLCRSPAQAAPDEAAPPHPPERRTRRARRRARAGRRGRTEHEARAPGPVTNTADPRGRNATHGRCAGAGRTRQDTEHAARGVEGSRSEPGRTGRRRRQELARDARTQGGGDQNRRTLAYATLTSESLALLLEASAGRRTLDADAGRGHLARVLRSHARDVCAVDMLAGHYVDAPGAGVVHADARRCLRAGDLILLSWPPPRRYPARAGGDLGAELVAAMTHGHRLAYIGEPAGLSCGTDEFHELVAQRLGRAVASAPVAPIESEGIHDRLEIYEYARDTSSTSPKRVRESGGRTR